MSGASHSSGKMKAKEAAVSNAGDGLYLWNEERLNEVRANKLWTQDPKYFRRVQVSPSATMKMLSHAQSGVEKGMSSPGGKPVEVMGLLIGRPSTDPNNLNTLIVTDAFPLPVEGAETRVLADDAEVINYMISLGEAIETTRKEKFMGWYHSHPFDVEVTSHCFLSSTDLSTQLQWQRSEDPHGNPWLAIVIDPLRSLAKKRPEMGAFRAYPPEYAPPVNETPDGQTDSTARVERWGSCWNRYYALEIQYFMSSLGSNVLSVLSEKFLWMRTLSSTPMLERENRERFSDRIGLLANKLHGCETLISSQKNFGSARMSSGYYVPDTSKTTSSTEESALDKCTQAANELSIEHCQGQALQVAKQTIFN
ncbi:COP9 signalosome complex subunit 5 [Thraustotheca clavata]|uniref:COP9 signalosome complex subunit 5 n=1 Tax=Thraustotheca clavata TaxID=74557 RepID=A0A1W0A9N7_9STRA|nr:COP9 signalosome complex subunit 5 [Thraustotheca clavata]